MILMSNTNQLTTVLYIQDIFNEKDDKDIKNDHPYFNWHKCQFDGFE